MKNKLCLSILIGFCLIFSMTVFAGDRVPGVTDTEIVIGQTVPMSGPAALWAAMGYSNKAWADHINAQGGIHGRKIKWVMKDDGYNPSRALSNLKEMKDEVFIFATLNGSASASAAKDFIVQSKVPFVHIHANPEIWKDLTPDQMRHIFIAYPDYVNEADAITRFAVNTVGISKFAFFYQNDDWGKTGKIGVEKAMKSVAGKAQLSAAVPYEVTDRALATHALKVKDSGAEGLLIYGTPTHATLIIKEMAKVGYRPKIFTCTPLGDPIMYRLAGELWEGAYPSSSANVAIPGVEAEADRVVRILTQYNPKLAGTPYLAVTGSTSMMLIAEALKIAGRDLTREKFVQAMESVQGFKPEGLGYPISFGPNRRHGLNGIRMVRAKGGKHVPISDFMIFDPLY